MDAEESGLVRAPGNGTLHRHAANEDLRIGLYGAIDAVELQLERTGDPATAVLELFAVLSVRLQ